MIYVYAIVEAIPGRPLPPIRGFGDEPVALYTADGIGAACGPRPPAALSPTAENVWLHEQVVEALMRDRPVLPARFGAVFPDEQSLTAALRERAPELRKNLEQVSDCVELGVRVLRRLAPDSSAPRPSHPPSLASAESQGRGRAYLMEKLAIEQRAREEERRAEQVAAALHEKLLAGTRAGSRRASSAPEIVLSAAYLVRREDVEAFTGRVRQLAADHPDLRLLCTGPWPPYHFVSPFSPAEAAHA